MNRVIEDYLAEVRRHLGRLPNAERDAAIHEMRSHLESEVERRVRERPELSLEEAALAATHDFGEPREIGDQYLASAPRRARPKWVLPTVVGLIAFVAGAGFGVMLSDMGEDYPLRVEHYSNYFSYRNHTAHTNDLFTPQGGVTNLRIVAEVRASSGCGHVRVYQAGELVSGATGTCNDDFSLEFAATGQFRIEYELRNFTGTISVRAYTWP